VKDGDDSAAIKTASEALSVEMQKIGETMQNAKKSEEPAPKTEEKPEDNIRDAEIDDEGKNV
jgi:hypothetical protein